MKVKLSIQEEKPIVSVVFTKNEYKKIKVFLENGLRLSVFDTKNLFGEGKSGRFYKDTEGRISKLLDESIEKDTQKEIRKNGDSYSYSLVNFSILHDDINKPVVSFSDTLIYLNPAFIRAIPEEVGGEYIISFKVDKFLNILEFKTIVLFVKSVVASLLNMVLDASVEIDIKD